MAISSGTRLGPYEIQFSLGAGGMGEVYRARDTRLDRAVAIKILPAHLADDPDAKQRFEREARAISSLSHPNICHLYDVGSQDGMAYIVMELLEGETLAACLTKGPLALDQVLKYGIEICDALDKAHRSGVVHRDLKPGNIMLTKSGAKLMDFGLAKSVGRFNARLSELTASVSSQPAGEPLTAQGTIVGTFQYISPEQLEGQEADARSDIFSLGAVFYEMLTGRKAFDGKSAASVIAAILNPSLPPIGSLQPTSQPALERVVKACLAKEPDNRWQNAHDLAAELRWISDSRSEHEATRAPTLPRTSLLWGALAALVLVSLALAVGFFHGRPQEPPFLRVAINVPPGSYLALNKQVSLSPDGRLVAMVLNDVEGKTRLWVRPLDLDKARALPGTDGAMAPFWSPDSQSLGFFTFDSKLKRISLTEGTVQTLCDSGVGSGLTYGAAWSRYGVIVFSAGNQGLFRVSSSGGLPARISVDGNYQWPSFLPDGRQILVTSGNAGGGIFALALEGGKPRLILPHASSASRYSDPGYILFSRQGDLLAQPFDWRKLEASGTALTLAGSVEPGPLSFSAAGALLLYVQVSKTQLTWVDQEGNRLSTVGEPGWLSAPYLSPDSSRAIVSVVDQERTKLWLFDFKRDTANPFTLGAGSVGYAAWSPDGEKVAFSSMGDNGQEDVYLKPVNGGDEQALLTQPGDKEPDKFSPDGRFLMYDYRLRREEPFHIWLLPMLGDHKPYLFLQHRGSQAFGTFSPDGKWVAYQSDETGQQEIFVVPFPGPGGRWQVSKGGGGQPFWPRGKEIFYVSNDFQTIAVAFDIQGTSFLVGKARRLFGGNISIGGSLGLNADASASIDVSDDGKRWLVTAPVDERNASPLILLTDWASRLKK